MLRYSLLALAAFLFFPSVLAQQYFVSLNDCKSKAAEYRVAYKKLHDEFYSCMGSTYQKGVCSGLPQAEILRRSGEISEKKNNVQREMIRIENMCDQIQYGLPTDPSGKDYKNAKGVNARTYNNVQDTAQGLHKNVQKKQSGLVTKIQNKAWDKIKEKNQETLEEVEEVEIKIKKVGPGSQGMTF